MRLILKDYIETLKEEKELESLIEYILLMNDYTDIVRPQKGIAQHGIDFSAQKDNQMYVFVLKQKDIDRTNWNAGNNAIRPTLDEIQDNYYSNMGDKDKIINIVVCTNGIIKQNVKSDWDGYINRNQSENLKYHFWGIDELTKLAEQFLINEYLFDNELKSILRKSLYFIEEENNLNYYNNLLKNVISKFDITSKNKTKYNKSLIVFLLIVKMCVYYAKKENTKISVKMIEKAIIMFWSFILENSFLESEREIKILCTLLKEYERCSREYINEIKKIYEFVPSFPIYNPLEHRIIIYETIGIIATFTYYLLYHYKMSREVKENIDIIITLINNNVAFYYPLYDLNCIEINILMCLLKESGNEQTSILVEQLINKIILRTHISKYYPIEYEDYDKALQIEFNEEVEECSASVLFTNLLDWLNVFEKTETINETEKYLYKKFPNITFNSIEIGVNEEKSYFKGDMDDSIITYVIKYNEKDSLETLRRQIYERHKIEDYLFYQYNAMPILFMTARHYRMPLPSSVIYQYFKKLKS